LREGDCLLSPQTPLNASLFHVKHLPLPACARPEGGPRALDQPYLRLPAAPDLGI